MAKMNFDAVISNPPFFGQTPEGYRRSGEHLDWKIYKHVCEKNSNALIVFCMHRSNDQKQKAGYTEIEPVDFKTVSIDCSIFVRDLKKEPIKITRKYENNGEHEWVRKNTVVDGISLNDIWKRTHDTVSTRFEGEIIPEGFIGINERSTRLNIFLPGETTWKNKEKKKLYKTIELVRTSDPAGLKKWLLDNVDEKFNEYNKKFGKGHLFRGFHKTVKIPERFV